MKVIEINIYAVMIKSKACTSINLEDTNIDGILNTYMIAIDSIADIVILTFFYTTKVYHYYY